jgi:hypothetical protein
MDAFSQARPDLPDALNDRAQDNWEHLLAIADIAGGHWPQKAKGAALSLSGIEADEPSQGTMILADIRDVFEARGAKDISSADLVGALIAMQDRPWGECNHGKALTQNLLARKLKAFGIAPKKVGPETKRVSGYLFESFADAFNRYIFTFQTGQPDKGNKINDLDENKTRQVKKGCLVEKPSNTLKLNEVSGCPVQNPQNDDSRECADDGDTWGDRF